MNKKYIVALLIVVSIASADTILGSTGVIKGNLLNVQLAKYDPTPAEAGKVLTLWIKAENKGIEPVPNATFFIETAYPFSLPNSDASRYYGRITGLDDIKLEYKVLVDKRAINGTYAIKMKYQTGDNLWLEKDFSITVSEFEREKNADLKALYVKTDPAAYSNGASRLTVDIANVGDGTAYYTIIKAESDVADIERDEIFVGTLNPNDFDSADFDMKFRNVTGGYPVKITMTYKDKDGNEVDQNDEVYISLISQEEAKRAEKRETPLWTYAIYLIALVLVLKFILAPIGKRVFKRKKN